MPNYTGKNIRLLYKAMGLSEQKFSERIGIPRGRMNEWYRGNGAPKADDTDKLTKFFSVSRETLSDHILTSGEAYNIVFPLLTGKTTQTQKVSEVRHSIIKQTQDNETSDRDLLLRYIDDLKGQIESLKKIISLLEKKEL